MYTIRCKCCNATLQVATPNRGQSCKCPNETYIRLDNNGLPVIIGQDISQVEMVSGFMKPKPKPKPKVIDEVDVPKRRIRRLDYEVR
jgi:hypothetical protein